MAKLAKKHIRLYKERWKSIASVETQELRDTALSSKFKQLCLLMNTFQSTPMDKKRKAEVSDIRKRWIALKKRLRNGGQEKKDSSF